MARRAPAASNGTLSRVPTAVLRAEIRRRAGAVGGLEKRRDTLLARIEKLDRQIEAMGGGKGGAARRAGAGARRRPRNEMTLPEALKKTLAGKTMSVTEAAEAVQRDGYRTSSSNFRTQVNLALIKGPFKRVGRGQYTAK